MLRLVQKYGGASLADIASVQQVARQVEAFHRQGHQLAIVVSAMLGETNRLLALAHKMSDTPNSRECDVLLSTGEQYSAALLTMALTNLGVPAVSFLSHQLPILTDSAFSRARIQKVGSNAILQAWDKKQVAVVAGFQGVDATGSITTLGRGGSDLTAVALAAALSANRCEVYKDVDGVFTADPDICSDATLISQISYEEMMEIASSGAKVLQARAVSFAKNNHVCIHVKPYLHQERAGTIVTSEDQLMEHSVVSAITIDKNEAKIGITTLPDEPGVAAQLFSALAHKDILVDMIVQNINQRGSTALSFTVPKDQADMAFAVVQSLAKQLGWGEVVQDKKVAKVSAIGAGMRTHSGVASQMFCALAKEGINISMIGTSEIRISCLIEEKYAELALRTLHEAFALGKPNTKQANQPDGRIFA